MHDALARVVQADQPDAVRAVLVASWSTMRAISGLAIGAPRPRVGT